MDTQTIFDVYNKINALESRVYYLEKQLEQGEKRIQEIKNVIPILPETKLLSQNFMSRSFTIFGHYTIAKMIINIIISIVVFLNWGLIVSALIKAISSAMSSPDIPIILP